MCALRLELKLDLFYGSIQTTKNMNYWPKLKRRLSPNDIIHLMKSRYRVRERTRVINIDELLTRFRYCGFDRNYTRNNQIWIWKNTRVYARRCPFECQHQELYFWIESELTSSCFKLAKQFQIVQWLSEYKIENFTVCIRPSNFLFFQFELIHCTIYRVNIHTHTHIII